jgi:hypothetical protein
VLQDLTDLEKVRSPHREICPASTDKAYQAISIKAEKLSDAEDEDDPVPVTFPVINLEPEVSCVSVSMLCGLHIYVGIPHFTNFCYREQITLIRSFFFSLKVEKHIQSLGQVRRSRHITTGLEIPPSQFVHMPCSNHTESAVLLMLTFHLLFVRTITL